MSSLKLFSGFGICLFIMTMLWGCATSTSGNVKADAGIPLGYRYYPKLQPGVESLDTVTKDLKELLGSVKNPGIKYYVQQGINNYAGEEALIELVKGNSGNITFWYDSGKELLFMAFSTIDAMEDRIEVSPQITFFYTDLINNEIIVEKTQEWSSMGRSVVGNYMEGIMRPYKIHFPGLISFLFENLIDAQRFADDLFFIQQTLQKKHDERLALFESKAAEYRVLKTKPQVPEEQRKYIVQANALSQKKEYSKAIDLYLKAVDLDIVSYPGAYFNLALLSAQMNRFTSAISYMKQYLQLEPEAQDARSAQDKIYEWELKTGK
jgi:tetratricopeptide (TPR) repeat protein